MRRSRQERASGRNTQNIARPISRPETGRPQVGLNYRQVVNSGIGAIQWATSNAGKVIALAYTPPAGMAELFDEYCVLSARVRLHFNTTSASSVSYGHSHTMCFDPSGVAATPADSDVILRYRNSDNMFLSVNSPIHEYMIRNCTHLSSDGVTLLSEPIKTESTWTIGNCYIAPAESAVTEMIRYTVEYVVVYSKPRASA